MVKVGCSSHEAATCYTSPKLYAEAVRRAGAEPIEDLAREYQSGRPRLNTPKSIAFIGRYHELRKLGAPADFASYYGKSPTLYARGLRILSGEESE